MNRSVQIRSADGGIAWRAGTLAGVLSTLALAWRGRIENRSAASTLNAPSHWLWGESALRQNRPTWRHTAPGLLIHQGSAWFWGALYGRMMHRDSRLQPGTRPHEAGALASSPWRDAAAVTAVAATVDLVLTPKRFRPGFEQRLSVKGTALVYGAFAAGLALGHRWSQMARTPDEAD